MWLDVWRLARLIRSNGIDIVAVGGLVNPQAAFAARLTGRPLVWQIYEQEELAHARKLDAFLKRYCAALPDEVAAGVGALTRAWNGLEKTSPAAAWDAFSTHLASAQLHARAWAGDLAALGDLAGNLASFCLGKLK